MGLIKISYSVRNDDIVEILLRPYTSKEGMEAMKYGRIHSDHHDNTEKRGC